MGVSPIPIAALWKLDVFQNMPYLVRVNINLENEHGRNCRADPQATRPSADPQ